MISFYKVLDYFCSVKQIIVILAVITGDIVASREIGIKKRQELYNNLKKFLTSLKTGNLITSYEMFRGDSFQCILQEPASALRTSLLIRAFIKAYISQEDEAKAAPGKSKGKTATKGYLPGKQDIRLSIGIGQVDFYNMDNLGQSDGEAFEFSGLGLDNLKKAPYRIALKTSDITFNEAIDPAILLLDAVLQKWTNNQAETALYKLKNLKEDEIGKELKISQPAVNQRVKSSQWFAIEKLLDYFENKLKDWN